MPEGLPKLKMDSKQQKLLEEINDLTVMVISLSHAVIYDLEVRNVFRELVYNYTHFSEKWGDLLNKKEE